MGTPISVNASGGLSEKTTVLMGMHGIIFLTIMPIAVSINGGKTDWQVFLIFFRICVLVLPSGMERIQPLKKGCLVWAIIREIMGKT
ncbi:MAG: hypothetical protein WDM78_09170 [Puia sp.]